MKNLAAAVERVKWLVNHNAKMEMIDRSDLETILAELGRGASVPAGWVLVPIEPTWDMRNEGREFLIDGLEKDYEKIAYFLWKTMVNASPKAPDTHPPVAGLAELTEILNFLDKIPKAIDAYGREGERRWNEGNTIHLELGPKHYEAMSLHDELQKAREFLGKVDV